MHEKKTFGNSVNKFLYSLLLILLLVSCKKEQPITTPTPDGSVTGVTAIDPTIAAVLAQISPTSEVTTASQDSTAPPTETPEFVCDPPINWVAYTVQSNDTLFAIADALGISIDAIKSANCKLDNALAVGEILYLPTQPTIHQPPPVNTQLNAPENTIQESTASIQELPEGVAQELFLPGGAGGGSHTYYKICSDWEKAEPGQIYVTGDEAPMIHIAICQPSTNEFSMTLTFPTGETVPLELEAIDTYDHPYYDEYHYPHELPLLNSYNSYIPETMAYFSYKLPLGHPYGMYTISVVGYPKAGQVEKRLVQVQKGLPKISSHYFGEEKPRLYHLYYFEPNETVHLITYENTIGTSKQQPVVAQTYQVNSDGYLVIEGEDEYEAVVGQQSGFVGSGGTWLDIANNSSEPICQLWLAHTGSSQGINLLYHWEQYASHSSDRRGFPYGRYDIEVQYCNGHTSPKMTNIELFHQTHVKIGYAFPTLSDINQSAETMLLRVINNHSTAICRQLHLTTHVTFQEGGSHVSSQIYYLEEFESDGELIIPFPGEDDKYDYSIEVRDCQSNVISQIINFEISSETVWEIP